MKHQNKKKYFIFIYIQKEIFIPHIQKTIRENSVNQKLFENYAIRFLNKIFSKYLTKYKEPICGMCSNKRKKREISVKVSVHLTRLLLLHVYLKMTK